MGRWKGVNKKNPADSHALSADGKLFYVWPQWIMSDRLVEAHSTDQTQRDSSSVILSMLENVNRVQPVKAMDITPFLAVDFLHHSLSSDIDYVSCYFLKIITTSPFSSAFFSKCYNLSYFPRNAILHKYLLKLNQEHQAPSPDVCHHFLLRSVCIISFRIVQLMVKFSQQICFSFEQATNCVILYKPCIPPVCSKIWVHFSD